jgi:glycosyltransferase 2 family protein
MTSPQRSGGLRIAVSMVLALIIGAVFLWLATLSVPLQDVQDFLRGADWGRIGAAALVFCLLYSLSHGARVVRWYFLVRPLGPCEPREVHRVCTVGFLAVLLLPFRLGEFVRPLLLARNTGLSPSGALGTVVVERVIDGLVVTGVLFLALWTYRGDGSIEAARAWGTLAAVIFVPAFFFAIAGYFRRDIARRVLLGTAGRIAPGVARKLAGLLDQFWGGVSGLVRRRDLLPFAGLTAAYWSMNWISMWALARYGFGLEIAPTEMVAVLAILVVGIMVPAGPAMAGNFEFFTAQGMGLFVPLEDSTVAGQVGAFAATLHVLQILVIVLPGVWVMFRHRGLRFGGDALRQPENQC